MACYMSYAVNIVVINTLSFVRCHREITIAILSIIGIKTIKRFSEKKNSTVFILDFYIQY